MQPSTHVSTSLSPTLPTVDEDESSPMNDLDLASTPNGPDPLSEKSSTDPPDLLPTATIMSPTAPMPAAHKSSGSRRRSSRMSNHSSMSSTTSIPGINSMIGVPGANGIYSTDTIDGPNNYTQYSQFHSDLHEANGNHAYGLGNTGKSISPDSHSRYANLGFFSHRNHNRTVSGNSTKNYSNTSPPHKMEYVPQSYGSSGVFAETEKLRQDLELEQMETANLDRQFRETRKKLENSLNLQSQLENDVVDMAKEIALLQAQIKDFKKNKHSLESELSQEQVNNLNEKQQWFDKEQNYEKTVKRLKDENTKLKTLMNDQGKSLPPSSEVATNTNDKQLPSSTHSRYFSMHSFANFAGFGSNHPSPASTASSQSSSPSSVISTASGLTTVTSYSNPSPVTSSFAASHSAVPAASSSTLSAKDKTIERLKMELEQLKQQTELVSREYTIRHNQIEADLAEQKGMVTKLMEENEGFQYLLAEKAILGGFASDAENSDTEGVHTRKSHHHRQHRHHSHHRSRRNSHNHHSQQHPENEQNIENHDDIASPEPISSKPQGNEKGEGTLTRNEAKSLHTGNSLADELERVSFESNQEFEESESDSDSGIPAKKKIYDLEFEIRALHNHNKALSLSLERLVHRLLEFKQFEQEVETSTMSGNINAASISNFQHRVASSSASVRSNSVGSIGKRHNNGFLPTSLSQPKSGYASNNGSNTQLNLQPTTSNSSTTQPISQQPYHHQQGSSIYGNFHFAKQSKHGTRDSVSSTTSSLLSRSNRSVKNPSLWNNMLLGGSVPGGGIGPMGFGHTAPGSRLSMISASSISFSPGGAAVLSPTSSDMHLGIDGDTSSGSSSASASRSNSTDGGFPGRGTTSANSHHGINSITNYANAMSISEEPDHLIHKFHPVNSSSSSVASAEEIVLNEVEVAILEPSAPKRPSTNGQRKLRPLSIYAQSS